MSDSTRSLFETVKLELKVIFHTFLYFLLFVPILALFIPIYLFRFIVSLAAKVWRKDLGKLIHPRSSVLSYENHVKNPHWNLVIWLTQEGVADMDNLRRSFHEEFVLAKHPDGKLKYPEYQQHYETWCGFQFWRWEDNFDINQHIRQYDGKYQTSSVVDDKLLVQIIKELTWLPWDPRRSPWEFLQIPNYQMTDDPNPTVFKSIMIFRLHHGLGDGYYILKLLLEDIGGVNLKDALGKPKIIKPSFLKRVLLNCFIGFVGPYQSMRMVTHAYDVNDWRIPEEKMIKPMNAALTPQIKLELIKGVKNSYGVSFTSVINAAIAGGIRKMMLQKGKKVPVSMHSGVAVPIPGHPDKLRNHFIFSFIALPTGTSDPVRRLKKAEKYLIDLKTSIAPLFQFMNVPLVGRIFPWMMSPTLKNRCSTCLISNFPGTPRAAYFREVNTTDMMFGAGMGPGRVGLGFTLISHTDHIRMLTVADPNILQTDEEVEELNIMILEEIAMLKELASQNGQLTASV